MPQNDPLNLSFVKDFHVVGIEMTRNGQRRLFMRCTFSGFFFTKLKKKRFLTKFVFYGIAFDPIRLLTG